MSKQGGIKDIAAGRSDVYRLAPDLIHVKEGWNTRDANDPSNAEHVEFLATSIAEIGVSTPLKVYWENGQAYVSDGHCRLAAVNLAISRGAEIKTIPVITENRFSNAADHVLTMIIGNSGKPLTPIETARVLKRLVDFGWTVPDIAKKIGRSAPYVTQLLQLNVAPQPVLDMITKSLVSASQASVIIAKEGPEKATETLGKAVAKAKAAGKKKATKRDIGETATGKTWKTEVREIFGRGKVMKMPSGGTWTFDADDFERLQELM